MYISEVISYKSKTELVLKIIAFLVVILVVTSCVTSFILLIATTSNNTIIQTTEIPISNITSNEDVQTSSTPFVVTQFDDEDEETTNQTNQIEFLNTSSGIVIDIGSSGTRLYIYKWINDTSASKAYTPSVMPAGPKGNYWHKYERAIQNVNGATAILRELLAYATEKISEEKRTQTPLLILATAGFRLLPPTLSLHLMEIIREIALDSGFKFQRNYARIISGQDEANFDWLSVQQVLFLAQRDNNNQTTGVIDIGGGSTEVAFEGKQQSTNSSNYFSTLYTYFNKQPLPTERTIYSHSYLPYGLNAAREKLQLSMITTSKNASTSPPPLVIQNPCLLKPAKIMVSFENKSLIIEGTSNGDECEKLIVAMFNKSSCKFLHCSFGGYYQPEIPKNMLFYGLSNYKSVLHSLHLDGDVTLDKIRDRSLVICSLTIREVERIYGRTSTSSTKDTCFSGLFIYHLLTTGFGFSTSSNQVVAGSSISGYHITITLGAMIEFLQTTN